MVLIDLCLSDIPNYACKRSEKNGKIYVSLMLAERREADQYGNTHSLSVSQKKEERDANVPKVYVGSGRQKDYQPTTTEAENPFSSENDKDLPF